MRLAGLEGMGGYDIQFASSVHSLSTWDAFLNQQVTDTVQMYYDDPVSVEGQMIHKFLAYLQGDWNLEGIANKYWEDVSDVQLPKGSRPY